jgi:hypothetical protein
VAAIRLPARARPPAFSSSFGARRRGRGRCVTLTWRCGWRTTGAPIKVRPCPCPPSSSRFGDRPLLPCPLPVFCLFLASAAAAASAVLVHLHAPAGRVVVPSDHRTVRVHDCAPLRASRERGVGTGGASF